MAAPLACQAKTKALKQSEATSQTFPNSSYGFRFGSSAPAPMGTWPFPLLTGKISAITSLWWCLRILLLHSSPRVQHASQIKYKPCITILQSKLQGSHFQTGFHRGELTFCILFCVSGFAHIIIYE